MRLGRLTGLRGRLAAGTLGLLVVGIVVVDTTAYVGLSRQLDARTESILKFTLDRGIALARVPGQEWTAAKLERLIPSNIYLGMYGPDGTLLLDRPPPAIADSPTPAVPPPASLPPYPTLLSIPPRSTGLIVVPRVLPADRPLTMTINGEQQVVTGFVAGITDTDDVETLRNLLRIQVWTALLLLAFGALSMFAILRFGLRPLRAVADTAHEISSGDLARRVPVTDESTEIGSVSAALNQAFDQVEASEVRMRTFVADASHELRTPLATIHGWADLYLHDGVREWGEVDVAMTRIRFEASRMNDLVEQLLTLARHEGDAPAGTEVINLCDLSADVIASVQVTAPDHTISLDADDARAVLVTGDPAALRQVITNLITNATKHTPPGTTVHVEVGRDGSSAILVVRDEGPGLNAADLERAFDRFWRADEGRASVGGSGLGLAIVRSITASHGGTVTLESEPGAGLTVTVRLPASS